MAYNSMFDQFKGLDLHSWLDLGRAHQGFRGSFREALDGLRESAENRRNIGGQLGLIVGAPRIVRGVIDYKVDFPIQDDFGLVSHATQTALGIYANPEKTEAHVTEFEETLKARGLDGLLDFPINQQVDTLSWQASHPHYNLVSLSEISNIAPEGNLTLVSLAHGGVMPALDIFLRYGGANGPDNSTIYPIRLSMGKKEDDYAMVSSEEATSLDIKSGNNRIVVFDEDSETGETMLHASRDIRGYIFPGRKIHKIINFDYSTSPDLFKVVKS